MQRPAPDLSPADVAAVVVAAGKATRLGREDGKAFVEVAGQPLLHYSIDAFQRCGLIGRIVVVIRPEDRNAITRLITDRAWSKCTGNLVHGGAERCHSVRNALQQLAADPPRIILIHDMARPLLSERIIRQCIASADRYGASVVATPAIDTVKISHEPEFLHETPPRRFVWQVQTPQTFQYELLQLAYQDAGEEVFRTATDDAELLERAGMAIHIVPGDRYNLKVTVPEDILVVESLLQRRDATGESHA